MDYFLIIVLGIVVISVWNSSRDANARMRDAVGRLERELDFLRSQLAALVRANAKTGESVPQAPAQPTSAEAVPKAATPGSSAGRAQLYASDCSVYAGCSAQTG